MSQQEQIINGYRILTKAGSSVLGDSFLAEEVKSGKKVILKAISPEIASVKSYFERYITKARLLASNPHPSIARIYGMFLQGQTYFIIEQYCTGGKLNSLVAKQGPLNTEKMLSLVKSCFEALIFAQSIGIHHGALHPGNIYFDSHGKAILTDFSVSVLTPQKFVQSHDAGNFLEPGSNGEPYLQGDVYSLGAVMYFMLTGNTLTEQARAKGVCRALSLDGVPVHIAESIERAVSENPQERFQTLQAFARAVFQAGAKAETKPPQPNKLARTFESPYAPVAERRVTKADTQETIPPEKLEFGKASPGRRAGAFLIDHMMFLAVSALCYALGMRTDADNYSRGAAALIYSWFILLFFLPKDGRRESRGVGKGVLGLRLVNKKRGTLAGQPIAALRYLLGALPYVAAFIIYPYAAAALLVVEMFFAFTGTGRRWMDFVTGTQVVNDEEIQVEDTFVVPVVPEED